MIKIGLLGFGVVGQSVAEILQENNQLLKTRTGEEFSISHILVRDTSKSRDCFGATLTSNPDDILLNSDIQVVIEMIGGEQPAFDYIYRALSNGKHVITANKEVVAKHKKTFFKLAQENEVDLLYEAAVGGGIPLIRSLKIGLAANHISKIAGILNGTTNYILTKIEEERLDFRTVLGRAQELGLAEADPTMDISGMDAAYKLVILAAETFGVNVSVDDIYVEGIEGITLEDMQYAKEFGYRIKLLAQGTETEHGVSLMVRPTLIPLDHQLSSIRLETNALFTVGDMVGETLLTGKGAGGLPTASAIVSDLIDVSFSLGDSPHRHLITEFQEKPIVPIGTLKSAFFIRLLVEDHSGILQKVSGVLGSHDVNITSIVQKQKVNDCAEIVLTTSKTPEQVIRNAIQEMTSRGILVRVGAVFSLLSSST